MSSILPYPEKGDTKKKQVADMFNNISGNYDFLNRLLSLGIDKIWRKQAIEELKQIQPKLMLDVATGTGDFAIEAFQRLQPNKIIGIDISSGMLSKGDEKLKKQKLNDSITLEIGDSENILYPENHFDAVTVAFGVRNFENLDQGLSEIFRVLKPEAKLVILEFSKPTIFPVKQLFGFYFRYVLPFIGKVFSKDKNAYKYLHDSVNTFPEGQLFLDRLKSVGFSIYQQKRLSFGICSIYTAIK